MFISVIIPTYKDWDRLKLCINALKEQTLDRDSFEVIIVNNDPGVDCPFTIEETNFRIVVESKPGSYAARNTGIENAKGGILAFTDSDCIPDSHWLENGLKHFKKNGCDLIGGNIEVFNPISKKNLAFFYEKNMAFKQESKVNSGKSVTANLFVRRNVFDNLRLFNDNLLSGGDTEFTKEATEGGYTIEFGPNITVYHPSRTSFIEVLKKELRVTAGFYSISEENKYKYFFVRTARTVYRMFLIFKDRNIKLSRRFLLFLLNVVRYGARIIFSLLLVLNLVDQNDYR